MVKAIRQVCLALIMLASVSGWAQTAALEQGVFNLHKFEQLIGRETYTLTRASSELV